MSKENETVIFNENARNTRFLSSSPKHPQKQRKPFHYGLLYRIMFQMACLILLKLSPIPLSIKVNWKNVHNNWLCCSKMENRRRKMQPIHVKSIFFVEKLNRSKIRPLPCFICSVRVSQLIIGSHLKWKIVFFHELNFFLAFYLAYGGDYALT